MENNNTRRSFLKSLGIASVMATNGINQVFASKLATSAFTEEYVPPKGNIRLPESDDQWRAVEDYVDELGIPACFRIRLRSVSRH